MVFLLLLAAVMLGYVLGSERGQRFILQGWQKFLPSHKRRQYFTELSQLLAGRADAGIETFIEHFKINQETVDIHFAVGDLLRKRGEVDKATQVHQNLSTSPALNEHQKAQAELALAEDYRAEMLLRPLTDDSSERGQVALEVLANLYEQEQEWQKAIATIDARRKTAKAEAHSAWGELQAHFYCELASESADPKEALAHIQKALEVAPEHARANSLMVLHLGQVGRVNEAVERLVSIPAEHSAADSLLTRVLSYTLSSDAKVKLKRWVNEGLRKQPSLHKALFIADGVAEEFGNVAAIERLCSEVPPTTHLGQVLNVVRSVAPASEDYALLKTSLLAECPPVFICPQCGFESQQHYWRCPTCKTWH